jgi:DNA replication protein DnaC
MGAKACAKGSMFGKTAVTGPAFRRGVAGAGVQLLSLDDWALEPLDAGARRDLYEILEERYGRRSTILTSQIPVDKWHASIGEPTYADAILDRVVHNAHRLQLRGDSLRKQKAPKITAA